MAIYAIGDLHFSGRPPTKPMDKFGDNWEGHRDKIIANWRKRVGPQDLVLICGDSSWAMRLPQAWEEDLAEVAALPGTKVILKGNHDYWWTSVKKMTTTTQNNFFFLQNSFYGWGDTAICGTRGWLLPECKGYRPEDEALLAREVERLEISLRAAKAAGYKRLVVALHYPPLYRVSSLSLWKRLWRFIFGRLPQGWQPPQERSPFKQLITRYGVRTCVYGHIHGRLAAKGVFEGRLDGCTYKLVSCDTQAFKLYKL